MKLQLTESIVKKIEVDESTLIWFCHPLCFEDFSEFFGRKVLFKICNN
jgi:DNA-binding MurR/RpiR family transcriptional regulator